MSFTTALKPEIVCLDARAGMIEAETDFLSAFLCYGSARTRKPLSKRTCSRKEVEVLDWYRKSVDETARALGTDAAMGLTAEEAGARLEKHGPNALKQGKKRTLWQM